MEKPVIMQSQIFQALTQPCLRSCFFLNLENDPSVGSIGASKLISIYVRHPMISLVIKKTQNFKIVARFPNEYPEEGIRFDLGGEPNPKIDQFSFQKLILEVAQINRNKTLTQILHSIRNFLNLSFQGAKKFQNNWTSNNLSTLQTKFQAQNGNSQKNQQYKKIKSSPDEQNIVIFFYQTLRSILLDQHQADSNPYWLQLSHSTEQKQKIEGLKCMLQQSQFRQLVMNHIETGRLFAKILKAQHGIQGKKYLIQHYRSLVQAVYDPQKLDQWLQTQKRSDSFEQF